MIHMGVGERGKRDGSCKEGEEFAIRVEKICKKQLLLTWQYVYCNSMQKKM